MPIVASVEDLLEQHDNYDAGDGWSISRRGGQPWHVYYMAKHIDCWFAEETGSDFPDEDRLTRFDRATGAFRCIQVLAGDPPLWLKNAIEKRSTENG